MNELCSHRRPATVTAAKLTVPFADCIARCLAANCAGTLHEDKREPLVAQPRVASALQRGVSDALGVATRSARRSTQTRHVLSRNGPKAEI